MSTSPERPPVAATEPEVAGPTRAEEDRRLLIRYHRHADQAAREQLVERLLPLARDRGIAVMVNRPFRQQALIRRFEGVALPGWADEIGASSWAQFILKFILSHPAVTVAIPATTRIDHVRENIAAAADPLPNEAMRRRMVAHIREF